MCLVLHTLTYIPKPQHHGHVYSEKRITHHLRLFIRLTRYEYVDRPFPYICHIRASTQLQLGKAVLVNSKHYKLIGELTKWKNYPTRGLPSRFWLPCVAILQQGPKLSRSRFTSLCVHDPRRPVERLQIQDHLEPTTFCLKFAVLVYKFHTQLHKPLGYIRIPLYHWQQLSAHIGNIPLAATKCAHRQYTPGSN